MAILLPGCAPSRSLAKKSVACGDHAKNVLNSSGALRAPRPVPPFGPVAGSRGHPCQTTQQRLPFLEKEHLFGIRPGLVQLPMAMQAPDAEPERVSHLLVPEMGAGSLSAVLAGREWPAATVVP